MNSLQGRVAIITGASRGLGKAIALELAQGGATLALIGRNEVKLKETATETGGEAHIFPADVTQEVHVQSLKDQIQSQFGRVDFLVNNAGVVLRKTLVDCTLEEWRTVIDSNLTSAFLMCRAFVPLMRGPGYGRIINIASTMSH